MQLFGERTHVRLDPESPLRDPDRLAAVLRQAGIAPESVRRVPTSLEDVFIARVTAQPQPPASLGLIGGRES